MDQKQAEEVRRLLDLVWLDSAITMFIHYDTAWTIYHG